MRPQFVTGIVTTCLFSVCLIVGIILDGWLHNVNSSVLPQPFPPSRFVGTITIDGHNVLTGTVVSAYINKTLYATTVVTFRDGVSEYLIDVPSDNPGTSEVDGGREGDQVVFKIPRYIAIEKGIWRTVPAELHLTMVKETVPIPEPVTLVLFGTGLAGLVAISKRRSRS